MPKNKTTLATLNVSHTAPAMSRCTPSRVQAGMSRTAPPTHEAQNAALQRRNDFQTAA